MSNLGNRGEYIGGSDLAALMGISPWKSRNAVLREKITGEHRYFTSAATEYGHEKEQVLLDADQMIIGYTKFPLDEIRLDDFGFPIILHLDSVGEGGAESNSMTFPVECKTSGKPFNGVLPDYYMPQVQAYIWGLRKLHAAQNWESDICDIARIVFGLRADNLKTTEGFWVPWDPEYWNKVARIINDAVLEIKAGRERLANGESIDDILGERTENAVAFMPESEVIKANRALALIESLTEFIEKFKDTMKSEMKKNGIVKAQFGEYTAQITADTTRRAIDTKALQKELPEVAEKYTKESKVAGALRITKKK